MEKQRNGLLNMTKTSLLTLKDTDFKPYLGTTFKVFFQEDISTPAKLKTVVDLPVHPKIERRPFSILLETENQKPYYPQAIYTVEHPALGALSIFLVPVGPGLDGMQYEAVFS